MGDYTPPGSDHFYGVNPITDYGAVSGQDCTKAIQAAINSVDVLGGVVSFPVGNWVTSAPITKSGAATVRLLGEAMGVPNGVSPALSSSGTMLWWNSPNTVLNVIEHSNGQLFVEDLCITPAAGPADGLGNVCVNSTGGALFLRNVTTQGTNGTGNAGTGVQVNNGYTIIDHCNLQGIVQALWMNGGQLCAVRDTVLSSNTGQASGCIRMDNGAQTLRLANTQTQGGDRGLYLPSTTPTPAFVFANDFEVNNPAIAGIDLQGGSQVYGTNVWLSAAGINTGTPVGLNVGAGFTGDCYLANSQLQDWLGGASVIAGSGVYVLNGCEVGGSGSTVADLVVNNANAVVHAPNTNFGTDEWYNASGKYAIQRLAGSVDYHGASFGAYSGGALAGCTPTVAALAANGTTPPAPTVAGSDTLGVVQFGTGTAPAAGDQVSVTFAQAFAVAPVVGVSAGTLQTRQAGLYWDIANVTTTGFDVGLANAPGASVGVGYYAFSYKVEAAQ